MLACNALATSKSHTSGDWCWGTYTTVGTVCSATLLGGLVDLDVLDNQGTGVETLGISVGLGVLQKVQEVLGRLDGPSGLGDTELLAYSDFVLAKLAP